MKAACRVAIVAAIVGVLAATFLLCSMSVVPGSARGTIRAIGTFELADRSFRSDVLGARVGLLRNYDALNRASADQRAALAMLRTYAGRDPALQRAVAELVGMTAQREAAAERFKSSNALVHNSLARFVVLTEASPHSAGLSARMLRLTLDTSPSVVGEAKAKIADLARGLRHRPSPRTLAHAVQVITHARLLASALPDTDALLTQILAFPVEAQIEKIRALAAKQQARENRATRQTEIAVVVTLSAFVVFMISTRLRLILRARALRRKIEVEHIGGTVSALLIDAQSHELPERIERGLAELGGYMEVDCAFLILHDDPPRIFSWSRTDQPLEGVPSALVDAAAGERWDGDRLRVTRASAVSHALAEQIEAAGLRSLKLLRATATNPFPATLGCGSTRPRLKEGRDVLLVCQMALAAILQAVRRDILEGERGQLERALQQARRMETIGAMATGVAHNFNNIMGVIGGFAETAALHVPPVSPVARNLDEISHAVDRARDLVDQILTFGRRPNEQGARIRIADLLAETGRMLGVLNPRVAVRVSVESAFTEIFGLASQVQQVIMNIGQNAAHAMHAEGTIDIVVTHRSLSKPIQLSHGRLAAGRFAVIEISDTGSGIDPTIMPHIFDPFFTTRQGGTGLGLSTAWEVIETHGGSIDVRSDAAGTRFALWVPLVGGPTPSDAKTVRNGNGHGDRVLLISNDARRIDGDEEILAVLGYEPVGIVVRAAPIDVPRMDMIDAILLIETETDADLAALALAQVRKTASGVPIILATEVPVRRHLQRPGILPVRYPLRVQELAAALSAGLQSSRRQVRSPRSDQPAAAPLCAPDEQDQRPGEDHGQRRGEADFP